MFQSVVECRSQENRYGQVLWVGKLACGCEFKKPKRMLKAVKDKPAPVRMKCYKHPEAKK